MERDRAVLSRETGCDADEAHPLPDDGRGTPEAESILFLFGEFPRSDHLSHGLRGTPQEGAAQALKRKNRTIGRRSCRQSTEMFFLSAPVRFSGRFRPAFFCISCNTSYRSRMVAFGPYTADVWASRGNGGMAVKTPAYERRPVKGPPEAVTETVRRIVSIL